MKRMTADEHLAWAKQRALEYLDAGDLANAVSSMVSDLSKHEAFRGRAYNTLAVVGLLEISRGRDAIKRWIEGFG